MNFVYRHKDKRRRNPKALGLTDINDLHRSISRMAALGIKNVDIARELNITPQTVSNVKNSPLGAMQIENLHGIYDNSSFDVMQKIRGLLPKCVETLQEILENPEQKISPTTRLKASLSTLAIAGHGPINKSVVVSGVLSKERIEELKRKAIDVGLVS